MSGDLSEEDLENVTQLRFFMDFSVLINKQLDYRPDWLSDESRESFADLLAKVLLIARKLGVSTTALGKAIALVRLAEENRQTYVEVSGTIYELLLISGNPIQDWIRVPLKHLAAKGGRAVAGSTVTRWISSHKDRFRRCGRGVYEVRADCIREFVAEEFLKLYLTKKVPSA